MLMMTWVCGGVVSLTCN